MPLPDDPRIAGDRILFRRIPPNGGRTLWSPDGAADFSSQNFSDKLDELSLYLADEATCDQVLAGHEGFGLVQITAGKMREILGSDVVFNRDCSDPIPGHVLVCGNIKTSKRGKLKKAATWVPGKLPDPSKVDS